MTTNTDLVRQYLAAIDPAAPDTERLATLVTADLVLVDVLMPLSGADTLLDALQGGSGMPITSTVQDVIGDDAAGTAAARVLVEVAGRAIQYLQWFWITDGRINRVEVIYDPRPFLELAAEHTS
ncbi:MAG: nuclear transport factor 2 family protein [Actinomycetota bacterium]